MLATAYRIGFQDQRLLYDSWLQHIRSKAFYTMLSCSIQNRISRAKASIECLVTAYIIGFQDQGLPYNAKLQHIR